MLRRFSLSLACSLIAVALAAGSLAAAETSSTAATSPARTSVLLYGDRTGHHRPEEFAKVLTPELAKLGCDLTFTQDIHDLNAKNLAKYDCLAVYGDSGDLPAAEERALLEYVDGGKGFAAIHCASHIFRNSQAYTALVGGRFWKHQTGVFRAEIIDAQHPAMRGVKSFESWDETYMHNELSEDRRVLMARPNEGGYEPWTWVRQQGKGRVFYTASGHDERTWKQAGYQSLLAAGMRWAAGQAKDDAPPLDYASAAEGLPNYQPSEKWGAEGARITKLQKPLAPDDSMKHMHLPAGFHVELFAAEPDIVKPICMSFDHRGRLWIVESTDYPNNVLSDPHQNGNDKVVVCEDTRGAGRADKFTVFADHLNIPTGIGFARGGTLLCVSPYMLFLKDSRGGDHSDVRNILLSGFGRGDTHGTHSNLHYGFDNWIYGSVGYDGGNINTPSGERHFHQGYFRFKSDGSDIEPLTTTSNNTWGLGLGENGDVFGSTANGEHSIHMGIANRYYEAVRGFSGNGSESIEDHKKIYPVTEDVRQVDHFGGFTAATGHEIYTARSFPEEYWNRAAFVCEPTGHLIHTDWLVPHGSAFVSRDGWNLMASDDAWTAPIAAQVGPDGAVWFIDWYTPVVQHNPTPHGFKTGAGHAYETPLRDKTHGRIYRIVADNAKPAPYPKLDQNDPATLIPELANDNLFWRLNAQRLLVERGQTDVVPKLAEVVFGDDKGPAALHALEAMHGLGAFGDKSGKWDKILEMGLAHRSPGVRRAALDCLPRTVASAAKIVAAKLLSDNDAVVRKDALLALSEMPGSAEAAAAIMTMFTERRNYEDRWIPTAVICAAAVSDQPFLAAAAGTKADVALQSLVAVARVVAEHYARGQKPENLGELLAALAKGNKAVAEATIAGLAAGWSPQRTPQLADASIADLKQLLGHLGAGGRSQVIALAQRWKLGDKFSSVAGDVKKALLSEAIDANAKDNDRGEAVRQLVTVGLDQKTLDALFDSLGPKSSPELTRDIMESLGQSRDDAVAAAIVAHWDALGGSAHSIAAAVLLSRPTWTVMLLDNIEKKKIDGGDLPLDEQQKLVNNADAALAARAKKILANSGIAVNADRQKLVDEFMPVTQRRGDFAKGKLVFEQNCVKCHFHGDIGAKIGPDLTGIAVRTKVEILLQVLNPNRVVEGNYQQYNLTTEDGRTFNGLLVADNKTSVEILDAEGKRHVVLRENIDSLVNTKKGLMPEGFEKLGQDGITNLLEFLTTRGKYLPLSIEKVATAVSTKGMFNSPDSDVERLVFPDWEPKTVFGVPFHLVDPRGTYKKNVILLHGPGGYLPPQMPKSVSIPCNAPAKAIHLLSGVGGWSYPSSTGRTVSMIVRLHYAGGATEDIPLYNGEQFADYIRDVEVPGSKLAFHLRGQQIRYLAVQPKKRDLIETIELVKGPDHTAPIVMAITVETGG